VAVRQNRPVITRRFGYLKVSDAPVSDETQHLQTEGYVMLRGVFDADAVAELEADVDRVYEEWPPDRRSESYDDEHWAPFRYEVLNRSEVVQRAIADPKILSVVEPLLGEDCHVIANTAWRQPSEENSHGGRFWHIDSGPHVPRPEGVPWDSRIPYPVFAVAAHIYLWDCPIEAGPTGVIPRSHTSGQAPWYSEDDDLEYDGRRALPLVADAGDVALFVSDVWHRRLPTRDGDPGRYFIQCHYGRRDLAQRLRPTAVANQLSDDAIARAQTDRERALVGLHAPFFYDG
jgi:ectoine hydroxylase-related dioxygenase (phytanoyl-CoA dioxygenase family)